MTATINSHDTRTAQKLQRALKRYGANKLHLQLEPRGQRFEIPATAVKLLETIIKELALGHPITLVPMREEISSQETAKLLGVSRPHLVGLLERGVIPFHKVGAHRRVKLIDALEYQAKLEALAELTREAQELNLGY